MDFALHFSKAKIEKVIPRRIKINRFLPTKAIFLKFAAVNILDYNTH